ncbi:uncharacterized protein FOMMEDRAFT_111155 [Fomitiporia mediterranea MF3/22]|uniref:uncharacterized protein n=1 Tax=Fomitiporia mediterranea (strain MF3/22) TaxID=694068 RepID=UPI0004409770|nr:uncharacterized protein FOMMEDRAFT_111155 [Fomitiporia mediterranea MF3/22]EJD01378.1 hypothetical protein FOMMEDRAFT_111155 [Fomitiporia mediterranea MF3/22]
MQDSMPDYPEQDETGGDGLPTYEDLAAQKGPNSRFGRWKGWVEKRAAERFADITPEERARRRERGWGEGVYEAEEATESRNVLRPEPVVHLQPPASIYSQDSHWSAPTLLIPNAKPPSYYPSRPQPETPVPASGEPLLPSHLKVFQFGSRFLPHTTYPMNALLPLLGDRLLLIGHDNGLSVLDMFPSGDPETSSPADAQVRHIWEGEGVYQLELLEFQDTGDLTPHGVVLALVGSEVESPTNSKERDVIRSIRMYNLSSLTSLARWATTQKNTKPLDLRRPAHWNPQQATQKKHKHNSSINLIKSLISDGQNDSEPQSSYPSRAGKRASTALNMKRQESASSVESSWDVIDELPLRWATDFVPLASAGSRLLNSNVLFFELWRGESNNGRGPSSLAIATKQSILLYETPKGERAFRFVKEFYAPLCPRNLSFVFQRASETIVLRSVSASSQQSQKSAYSPDNVDGSRRFSSVRQSLDYPRERNPPRSPSPLPDYGAQLSLFVVFDKKAGLIRLADAAVGEVELNDDSPKDLFSPIGTSPRRSFIREHKGIWLPPTLEELPLASSEGVSVKPVYILTRGKQTHVIPSPIPTPLSNCPPLYAVTWQQAPSQVCHRICSPLDDPAFLQIIGFGEYGIEVHEIPLSVFSKGKSKGKGRAEEPVHAQIDIGGDVAFLFRGGQWHEPRRFLARADSFMSTSTASTVRPGGLRKSAEDGFYASCRKGLEDWRVFWLGGEERDDYGPSDI